MQKGNELFLSKYDDNLTPQGIARATILIKQSFPDLELEFYNSFVDLLKESEDMTDMKLHDSVVHVIKNCVYPKPTIANFFQLDSNVKLYSYTEMVELSNKFGGSVWDMYSKKKVKGVVYWYRIES